MSQTQAPRDKTELDGDKEPHNSAIRQQRMNAWHPILHPTWVTGTLVCFGFVFVGIGVYILSLSNSIVELKLDYSENAECSINKPNENRTCFISFTVNKDMKAPILVHYQLSNFHQNHRTYLKSRDNLELAGVNAKSTAGGLTEGSSCELLKKLGDITLNPCGLIANTFFNDIFKLVPREDKPLFMEEKGIARESDLKKKYKQPFGFNSEECEDCNDCSCDGEEWSCEEPYVDKESGKCWKYFYPDEETTQYLYETYPMKINPIEGVTNEHFVVWMDSAASNRFRKLYGFINHSLNKDDTLMFEVINNFEVESFDGTKALILSTTNKLGGKNDYLGQCCLAFGIFCSVVGALFLTKILLKPRLLGDTRYLKYKEQ